jgi:hypothetical protein
MPVNQITNPAESTEANQSAIMTAQFIATGAIAKGMGVQLLTTYPLTTGVALKVKKATTTANILIVGIAARAATSGTLVTVVVYGPVQALLFTTIGSTKAQAVLQTNTNAGYVKTAATPVLGKTYGVCLQTVAGAASKRLAWIYLGNK